MCHLPGVKVSQEVMVQCVLHLPNKIQGQILFLVIPNQKVGEKSDTLVWRVIAIYLRKLE